MKPIATLILAVILLAFMPGCKKDSSKSNNGGIEGTWANKQIYPNATARATTYTFNSDGKFEIKLSAFDPVSDKLLGYFYKSTGSYTLTANQLEFSNVTNYAIKDNGTTPVPEDQLVALSGQGAANTYTYAFNAKKDSLALTINCPPNASCIGLQWYKRQ